MAFWSWLPPERCRCYFCIQSFETSASKVLEYFFFGRFQGVWFCWKMNVKKISQQKILKVSRFPWICCVSPWCFLAKDNTLPLGKRTEMVKDILKDAPRRLVREVLMEMDEDFSWGFLNSTVLKLTKWGFLQPWRLTAGFPKVMKVWFRSFSFLFIDDGVSVFIHLHPRAKL